MSSDARSGALQFRESAPGDGGGVTHPLEPNSTFQTNINCKIIQKYCVLLKHLLELLTQFNVAHALTINRVTHPPEPISTSTSKAPRPSQQKPSSHSDRKGRLVWMFPKGATCCRGPLLGRCVWQHCCLDVTQGY
ncbi:hypothetical protein CEXT_480621 [Caerostris extrusa]|uniref:Uncharacterized protein n=1 Tax=Caerostris extrusa TaxID=172846 RepID=A0AAV4WUN0_CAEEX|nr:hypothetical protein CEXT_480621 [Caerostris extrusa]